MNRFLKITFLLSYLLWGAFFLHGFSELMLRNAWFDIFNIQKVKVSKVEIIRIKGRTSEINYEFEYKNKRYSGKRKVISKIIESRLPKKKANIEVSFNTLLPQINYLNQLGLKTRNGTINLIASTFALLLTLCFDIFGNKEKWIGIYKAYTKVAN